MDQERIEELRRQAENRTELEERMVHTLFVHLGEVQEQLQIALVELLDASHLLGEERDERLDNFFTMVQEAYEAIGNRVVSVIESIPGLPTIEESEAERRQAIMKGLLDNSITTEELREIGFGNDGTILQ